MSRIGLFLRVLLGIVLLLIHYLAILVPVSEIFLIYILLFNPRWFRAFLNRTALNARSAKNRNNASEPGRPGSG